jgi:hypothetical protein
MDGVSFKPEQRIVELVGTNVLRRHGPRARRRDGGAHARRAATGARPTAPAWSCAIINCGLPGLTVGGGHRAKPVMAYWPTLIDKARVEVTVTVEEIV